MSFPLTIADREILPGSNQLYSVKISESTLGSPVEIPIQVIASKKEGPIILTIGGIHGDEMNGVGTIRNLMVNPPKLKKGILICLPLVNIFGFEENSRYLPDRRDLNRCFPGKKDGSLGLRIAHILRTKIVSKCTHVIDLHSAAFPRTNYHQIRANLNDANVRELVNAFKSPVVLDGVGHKSTLRSWASKNGIPTIVFETGETNKIQPDSVRMGLVGIKNVLKTFGMISGKPIRPPFSVTLKTSTWLRSQKGGIFHPCAKSGDVVKKGQVVATVLSLMTQKETEIKATRNCIVLGLTTRPAIKPGEPICNVGYLNLDQLSLISSADLDE